MKSNEWLFQMKNKERFVANPKGLSYSSMAIKDIAWGSWMMGLICNVLVSGKIEQQYEKKKFGKMFSIIWEDFVIEGNNWENFLWEIRNYVMIKENMRRWLL